ncbi:MAG TPA: nuclear transport factor 2 family protein [Candidatus Acidoferrales bacterium]|nr:nuclear transport factor 2 family protein [Candidatus Acidoferrales bacterium]
MIRRLLLLGIALTLVAAWPAAADLPAGSGQKQKQQNQKESAQQKDDTPLIPLSDEQQVDNDITQMLGAWQIGDVEMLRKYYADNVLVVSGLWEPPLIGLDRYIHAYQLQRERMQGPQVNRSNTFIRVEGTIAWAVYQWTFTGIVDGQPTAYRCHTTLVFEKRDGKWLIITNHTSLAAPPPAPQNAQPGAQPPAKP